MGRIRKVPGLPGFLSESVRILGVRGRSFNDDILAMAHLVRRERGTYCTVHFKSALPERGKPEDDYCDLRYEEAKMLCQGLGVPNLRGLKGERMPVPNVDMLVGRTVQVCYIGNQFVGIMP